jgi:lipooligosaccharide transport system permease protein
VSTAAAVVHGARSVLRRNVAYLRGAHSLIIISGFVEPLIYLLSLGRGIGSLVGDVAGPGGELISYSAFLAPALLAGSAMNGAAYEVANVHWKLREQRIYNAAVTTPVGVVDIMLGELAFAIMRGAAYIVGFAAVMAAFGFVTSWWGLLLVPAALLISVVFGCYGLLVVSRAKSWNDMDFLEMVLLPLLLFSSTFVPLANYPNALQWAVRLTPLYHGVELCRALASGVLDWSLVVHVGYLVTLAVALFAAAAPGFRAALTD